MEDDILREYAVRSARGEKEAAERLVLGLHQHLFAFVHLLGIPRQDVEDCAQEIMIQVLGSVSRYDDRRPFLPWFRSIARHVVSHYWRAQKHRRREVDLFKEYVSDSFSPEGVVGDLEDMRRSFLVECLERLQDRQRAIISLFYEENLTCSQIGERVGAKSQTVRKILCKIRELLGACISRKMEAEA